MPVIERSALAPLISCPVGWCAEETLGRPCPGAPATTTTTANGNVAQVAHSFNKILAQPAKKSSRDAGGSVKKLRRLTLIEGISSVADGTLWHRVWKIFIRITDLPVEMLLDYVARGPCEVRERIRNDSFRSVARYCVCTTTLTTDRRFTNRVKEDMLIRLRDGFYYPPCFTYVQGMNVLAAPFLYTMPSALEAFLCFAKPIKEVCPTYVRPTLEGVHHGLKLLDHCLKIVDPDLYVYLRSKNSFPSALTLCACTPPLDEVLRLWNFFLAFGVHLNVLCVIAQLLLLRDDVMKSSCPHALPPHLPPLEAAHVVSITIARLVRHPDKFQA
ncbi:rab-GTPase-TBC domain-containing protein [Vararia minispora EC-137]|uniref:Rab-GTPase-TBC domain-containing protein n=1 Tax=Vararia minispora EC-137 TaxID=1314806 RepID=A0ACB8Q7V7_9AGAM|nr:rab-GTPase-TBC domain-containing protein [Vararia minispora EC-137]